MANARTDAAITFMGASYSPFVAQILTKKCIAGAAPLRALTGKAQYWRGFSQNKRGWRFNEGGNMQGSDAEHPHDTPPPPFMPSPTSAHSSAMRPRIDCARTAYVREGPTSGNVTGH